ncbi:MAG TPA: hypothetical protein VKT73_04610 [Xanthobacteraceae bacterium]|nr:hypothetical protein [Xanthobacteraceae bacterium]
MFLKVIFFALRGSVSMSAAWAPFAGAAVLWVLLRTIGRSDVILPTTIPGQIEFGIVSAGLIWILIVLGRILYAPYYFLRQATTELSQLKSQDKLEILYDPSKKQYREVTASLHSSSSRYFFGVKNKTTDKTIRHVIARWDKKHLTEYIDENIDRKVLLKPTDIHPEAEVLVYLFGLDDHVEKQEHPHDILKKRSTFVVRVSGEDAREVVATFEFDPTSLPMIRRLT